MICASAAGGNGRKSPQRAHIEEEMSAEGSTPDVAAERTDRSSDGGRAAADPRPGSRAEDGTEGSGAKETAPDTPAPSVTAQGVTGELIALDFGVHKSIRYHAKRRAFFDVMHRIAMLVAVVGGSAAFFALIGDNTGDNTRVGQIAALVVATLPRWTWSSRFPKTPASTTSSPSGSLIWRLNFPWLNPARSMAGGSPS
jgi:hypothetical protein